MPPGASLVRLAGVVLPPTAKKRSACRLLLGPRANAFSASPDSKATPTMRGAHVELTAIHRFSSCVPSATG